MARRYNPDQLELFPLEPEPPRESPLHLPRTRHGQALPTLSEDQGALEAALLRITPDRTAVIEYRNNETIILSLKTARDGTRYLRAHECFRRAPPDVAEAAVRLYLTRTRRDHRRHLTHLLMRWHHESAQAPPSLPRTDLDPGTHHDLRAVLAAVNAQHFEDALDMDITFGSRIAQRTMGRHEKREPRSCIVINPLLDHPWITRWYLEYLVFHECLHEIFPPKAVAGRMLLHPPEFRSRERQHPDWPRASGYEAWITGPAYRRLSNAAQKRISSKTATKTPPQVNATTLRISPGRPSEGGGDP